MGILQKGTAGLGAGDIVYIVQRGPQYELSWPLVVERVTPRRIYVRTRDPDTEIPHSRGSWGRHLGGGSKSGRWFEKRGRSSPLAAELLVNPLPSEERAVGYALARARTSREATEERYRQQCEEIAMQLDATLAWAVGVYRRGL